MGKGSSAVFWPGCGAGSSGLASHTCTAVYFSSLKGRADLRNIALMMIFWMLAIDASLQNPYLADHTKTLL